MLITSCDFRYHIYVNKLRIITANYNRVEVSKQYRHSMKHFQCWPHGTDSISHKTSHRKISQNAEGVKSGVNMLVSLWNLTSALVSVLSRRPAKFQSNWETLATGLASSNLCQILQPSTLLTNLLDQVVVWQPGQIAAETQQQAFSEIKEMFVLAPKYNLLNIIPEYAVITRTYHWSRETLTWLSWP